ncbi:hypothetical protein FHS43_002288 [Streptosporangium becharense]|uniref:DUF4832 domain-containing protein n=1 Tax=Streptosporangium becharense TaxID=1816182 RepID=A0A7W9IKT9_9ACTN|nr:DUF4832 domain-containing protein [Streptosporangium becharense]MBB2911023.1 hypothetical protein [Streptosporangium becharense]MBB5821919.1 hypothetical protein [Streptosporangium becharense]
MVHSLVNRPARMAVVAVLTAVAAALPAPSSTAATQPDWRALAAAEAPDANPLEGFIPYAGAYTTFPHSMEWFYLPLNAVMTGPHRLDWRPLEEQLNAIAARGHQAAFRFYLDYPGKPSGIPKFLLDQGLLTRPYDDFGNNGQSVSPDYDDPNLTTALDRFIAALGRRYDGDPRVGFVQLGLLGFWGEWHTWPHNGDPGTENWFASQAQQLRVLNAYDEAFDETRLMVRYPGADNKSLDMGYHDDSFAYSTLPGPGWHFMDLMRQAGTTDKWKSATVAGELRPELQGCIFNTPMDCTGDGDKDFAASVAQTHASWLLNHYAFSPGYTGAAYDKALAGAKSLGYRLRVTAVKTGHRRHSLNLALRIRNDGVAPFSYDWPLQVAAIGRDGRIARTWTTSWKLTGIMPGVPAELTADLPAAGLRKGDYTLVLRAANPLPGGMPLRFANADQDTTVPGWLTLGRTRVF